MSFGWWPSAARRPPRSPRTSTSPWPTKTLRWPRVRFAVEAVKVHKWVKSENLAVSFPSKHAGNTYPFKEVREAPAGVQILTAEFAHPVKDSAVKDAKLELSADKTKLTMSGMLVKASGLFNKNAPPPSFSTEVKMTMESRSKAEAKPMDPVAQTLQVPGTTLLPIPAMSSNWTVQRREMQMELRVGKEVLCARKPSAGQRALANQRPPVSRHGHPGPQPGSRRGVGDGDGVAAGIQITNRLAPIRRTGWTDAKPGSANRG